jgi:hypothetical protein
MLALGDELLEVLLHFADHIGPRHTDNIEALRARLAGERLFDRASL